jgi:hypothetical protein
MNKNTKNESTRTTIAGGWALDHNKMSEQRILQIRESIAVARGTETENHTLEYYLMDRLPNLHHSITLPEADPHQALLEFVTRYIEHVPDFIEALTELTREAGIYEYAKTFITIAEDYFLKPPELVNDRSGMQVLIDEAYLAHRLIEEINDRITLACGIPLAPLDTTLSNIIMHDILGEEFANQLDLAVHYAIEALFNTDSLLRDANFKTYVRKHKQNGWDEVLKRWPCLAEDSAISLNLNHVVMGPLLH